MLRAILMAGLIFLVVAVTFGDRAVMSYTDLDQPAIQYNTQMLHDPGSQLNRKIQFGEVHLKFDGPQGYLRSVLEALDVPSSRNWSSSRRRASRQIGSTPTTRVASSSAIQWWWDGYMVVQSLK